METQFPFAGSPPPLGAAVASDVFAGSCSVEDSAGIVNEALLQRRLREYREVLQKLDRDRALHDVERVRLG